MRILQVVNSLDVGGIEQLAVELSAGLRRQGHESIVCCLEGFGPLAETAASLGIRVVALGKRNGVDLRVVPKLRALMRRERIDVVHTHNMSPLLYGTLAARLARVRRIINTRHGREAKRQARVIWNLNDAIVAISEDARQRLLAHNRLEARRVQVIYNGIDSSTVNGHAHEACKRQLGLDPTRRVIGTVGRLAEEKDQATLLRAFATLRSWRFDIDLVLAGDGPCRVSLERLARELGVAPYVRFLGFRTDIRQVLDAFEVFVLSSLTEGIALTLLEAMAAARPVVATRVGGNPEVVVDGITGHLVPPQHPWAMAEALRAILANPELGRRLGAAGRARVETHFSLARMVRDYAHLYETPVDTAKPRSGRETVEENLNTLRASAGFRDSAVSRKLS